MSSPRQVLRSTRMSSSPRQLARTPINADGVSLSTYTLGIIYSMIARGNVILVHYACCHGNFSEVVEKVLKNIPFEQDGKLTYASGDYMYHYICEDGVVYLCITDDDFERSKAFLFLEHTKRRFQEAYSDAIQNALPFAMNSEYSGELAKEMRHFTETGISLLQGHVRLEQIGVRDLDLSRAGDMEQLELLESTDSVSMRSYESLLSLHVSRKCEWFKNNWKPMVIFLVIALFIIVTILAVVVGICSKNHCRLNNN